MKLLNRCATSLVILSLSSSLLCAETKSTPSEKEEAAEKEALTPELRPALAIQSGKVDFHAKIPRTGTPFPRFSWLIAPQDRGQLQSAYQIIVAESEEECKAGGKLAWDSGRVESKEKELKALLADLKERGLRCGILGQTALLPVLTWTGNTDQALTYARNFSQKDQEPSIVANAVVQEWLFSFLAGFIHEGPGFKVGRISPFIPEDKSLTSLSASHLTPYGKISVTWEKKKDHLSVKVTIPPNTTGIIALPASPEAEIMEGGLSLEEAPFCQLIGDKKGRKEIIAQSGNYHFTVKSREDAQSNK